MAVNTMFNLFSTFFFLFFYIRIIHSLPVIVQMIGAILRPHQKKKAQEGVGSYKDPEIS